MPRLLRKVGAARVAHDHREVAVLDAVEADLEVALGLVGDVVCAVVGRVVVGVGVDAKEGEVARVAGPHPVVGVATKLADALRGVAHEADVVVIAVDKEVELVGVVE